MTVKLPSEIEAMSVKYSAKKYSNALQLRKI